MNSDGVILKSVNAWLSERGFESSFIQSYSRSRKIKIIAGIPNVTIANKRMYMQVHGDVLALGVSLIDKNGRAMPRHICDIHLSDPELFVKLEVAITDIGHVQPLYEL